MGLEPNFSPHWQRELAPNSGSSEWGQGVNERKNAEFFASFWTRIHGIGFNICRPQTMLYLYQLESLRFHSPCDSEGRVRLFKQQKEAEEVYALYPWPLQKALTFASLNSRISCLHAPPLQTHHFSWSYYESTHFFQTVVWASDRRSGLAAMALSLKWQQARWIVTLSKSFHHPHQPVSSSIVCGLSHSS